ncbi:hypothetical protein [Bradyrhizobium sp. USDA 4350]
MDKRSAQIATICECIDHRFAFTIWCEDLVKFFDEEDIVGVLDRGAELMAEATRLMSFVALRKLDDFLRGAKSKPDDLVAGDFGIDVPGVLAGVAETFLTRNEHENVNKGVAHLTENLALDDDSEVDLQEILIRLLPALERLASGLRTADTSQEASQWLDKTEALIERVHSLHARQA